MTDKLSRQQARALARNLNKSSDKYRSEMARINSPVIEILGRVRRMVLDRKDNKGKSEEVKRISRLIEFLRSQPLSLVNPVDREIIGSMWETVRAAQEKASGGKVIALPKWEVFVSHAAGQVRQAMAKHAMEVRKSKE